MRRLTKTTLAVLLAAAYAVAPPLPVLAQAQPSDQRVSLHFVDTDIPAVLRALSLFTQRTYMVDPRVQGTLPLLAERPVARDHPLTLLPATLGLQSFATP